jgi:hypothetical protein
MTDKKPDEQPKPRMVKPPANPDADPDARPKSTPEAPARPKMVKPPSESADAAASPPRPRMVKPPSDPEGGAAPTPKRVTPPGARTPGPSRARRAPAAAGRSAASRRRPPSREKKPPVALILGAVGLVVAIAVVAVIFSSGSGDEGKESGKSRSSEKRVGKVDPSDGRGKPAPKGSERNIEDEIDAAAELQDEYRRRKILAETDKELYKLAVWCKKNGLDEEMRATARSLLEREPRHSGAHRLLGHRLFEGDNPDYMDKWLTREEYAGAVEAEKEYQDKLRTDPRFEAMESAIKNAKHLYLRDVPHFAVREWPYVLFVEDFGTKERNEYYSHEKADQVRCFWRYMNETFPGLVNKEPKIPFRVIVFKDAASYNRFNSGQHSGGGSGGTTSRARAHFSLRTKFVYYYEKNAKGSNFDAETTLGVLFHECTHQLLNWLRPHGNKASPSMWFEEAFAEYIGAVRKTGKYVKDEQGRDRMTFDVARVNKYRIAPIQVLIKRNQIFTLEDMFRCRSYEEANSIFSRKYGKRGGMGQSLLYCQGWSFVYFCMNEPSGKYRDKMIDYIRKDAAGDSYGYETLLQCFGLKSDADWKPIQKEWLSYTRRLKKDGTLRKRKP